jgi:hypothetical protein
VSFNENVLGFNPESATYRDASDGTSGEVVAERVLKPFAEALIRSSQSIVIVGSAWNDGSGDELELSRLRANRVRNDLVAMGVPESQLIVIGIGNLGTDIQIGDKIIDFFHPDNPPASRAIHFVPIEKADDLIAKFD